MGMSAPFTGANRGLGVEYYRGMMAYLEHVNAKGGVEGWKIRVKLYDDGYNPIPCVQNTIDMVGNENVFALFSYIGTPTVTRILPLLKKYENKSVYLLFPLTGAQPHRQPPYDRYVYNLRASYFEETAGLVDNFVAVGRKRIAVFYQADAYGRSGWDGVRRALGRHGLDLVGEAAYVRGANFSQDFTKEAKIIRDSQPEAVIVIGTYASAAAFIRDSRNIGLNVPIAGVSFGDSDNLLTLLMEEGARVGKDYTRMLINSQVVPSYEDLALPAVSKYRSFMDASNTHLPPDGLMAEEYWPHRYSFVSFEGFLNAIMLCEVIRRMADDPRPDRIPEAIESIRDFDLGVGLDVSFGPDRHQGLERVYYTTVVNGRFVPVRNWSRLSK